MDVEGGEKDKARSNGNKEVERCRENIENENNYKNLFGSINWGLAGVANQIIKNQYEIKNNLYANIKINFSLILKEGQIQ